MDLFSLCDLAGIIGLIVFIVFIFRVSADNRKYVLLFATISILAIISLSTELIDEFLAQLEPNAAVINSRLVLGFLEFGFFASIPSAALSYFHKTKLGKITSLIPFFVTFILCFVSIFYPVVFSMSPDNHFIYGPVWLLPIILSYILYALFFIKVIFVNPRFGRLNYGSLILFYACALAASIIQIFTEKNHVLLIWNVVATIIILTYALLQMYILKIDQMTGLLSRSSFERYSPQLHKRRNLSVIVCDLDNLKKINDDYGHYEGDNAISCVSSCLNKVFPKKDFLFRYGGDEFLVLSAFSMEEATIRIHEAASLVKGHGYGISYGVSYCEKGVSLSSAVSNADLQMYEMKKEKATASCD